jgi:hypothetical protein
MVAGGARLVDYVYVTKPDSGVRVIQSACVRPTPA